MNVAFNPVKQSTESAKGQPHGAESFLALLNLADPEAEITGSATLLAAKSRSANNLLPTGTSFMAGATGKRRGQAEDAANSAENENANVQIPIASKAQSVTVRPLSAQSTVSLPNAPASTDAEQAQTISCLAAKLENSAAAMAQMPTAGVQSSGPGAASEASAGTRSQSAKNSLQANWNAGEFVAPALEGDIATQATNGLRPSTQEQTSDLSDSGTEDNVGMQQMLADVGKIASDLKGHVQTQMPVSAEPNAPAPGQAVATKAGQYLDETSGNISANPTERLSAALGNLPLTGPITSKTQTRFPTASAGGPTTTQLFNSSATAANSGSRSNEAKAEDSQSTGGEKHIAGDGQSVQKIAAQSEPQVDASVALSVDARIAASETIQSDAELFKGSKLSGTTSVSPASSAQVTAKSAAAEKNSDTQQKAAKESDAALTDQSLSSDAAFIKQIAAAVKTDDPLTQNVSSQSGPVAATANAGTNSLGDNLKSYSPAPGTSAEPHVTDEPMSPKPEINTTPMGSVQTARLVQNLSETEWRVGIQAGEFGKVDIHTSISQSQISARIYVEHDELSKALAGGLPQLHEKLSAEHRMDAQVELYNSGSNYSSGADRQHHQQQQQRTMEQNGYASSEANEPARTAETVLEPSGSVSASGVDMHV